MAPVPPYGVAIQQAIAASDLAQMKRVAREAEEHLKETGNVAAALEVLKIEIAKLEARQGGATSS